MLWNDIRGQQRRKVLKPEAQPLGFGRAMLPWLNALIVSPDLFHDNPKWLRIFNTDVWDRSILKSSEKLNSLALPFATVGVFGTWIEIPARTGES